MWQLIYVQTSFYSIKSFVHVSTIIHHPFRKCSKHTRHQRMKREQSILYWRIMNKQSNNKCSHWFERVQAPIILAFNFSVRIESFGMFFIAIKEPHTHTHTFVHNNEPEKLTNVHCESMSPYCGFHVFH